MRTKERQQTVLNDTNKLPRLIRVSLGTAMVLELTRGRVEAPPTTAYLMTYSDSKCTANCGFCPQSRTSSGRGDMLSRISWPAFPTQTVLGRLAVSDTKQGLRRVCIQALNYPEAIDTVTRIVALIRSLSHLPISVSCQPMKRENILRLRSSGVERIGIPLDVATETLFDGVKGFGAGGPYDWASQWKLLDEAVRIFGRGLVSSHFIVGLGESEREMVEALQKCWDMGVRPCLFAFTPIKGTRLDGHPQPSIRSYRRMQLARYLIVQNLSNLEKITFTREGTLTGFGLTNEELCRAIGRGSPFLTSGCPGCNRPYYNEKPRGVMYNFPRELTKGDFAQVIHDLDLSAH